MAGSRRRDQGTAREKAMPIRRLGRRSTRRRNGYGERIHITLLDLVAAAQHSSRPDRKV